MKLRDLTGQQFSRLRVIGIVRERRVYWLCMCSCGRETTVASSDLVSGHTTSCGCLQAELTSARNRAAIKHGDGHGSLEYTSWNAMKMRCSNPKNIKYHDYGERGIKVCQRWANSYELFLADMGRRPTPQHSLDRYPNPDGDYEPGNCRWATPHEQRHNRSMRKSA